MAMEHARSFVEKLFDNDEFLKQVIIKRGFKEHEGLSEDLENERMVKIANEMGFRFTVEEYAQANEEYMNEIGGFGAMKKIFHMIKVAASVEKENKI